MGNQSWHQDDYREINLPDQSLLSSVALVRRAAKL
jgi:hypothetical protein